MLSVTCQHCTARFDVQSLPAAELMPVGQLRCPACAQPAVSLAAAGSSSDVLSVKVSEAQTPMAGLPDAHLGQATWPPPPLAPPATARIYPETPLPDEFLVPRAALSASRATAARAGHSAMRGRMWRVGLALLALAMMALWRPPLVALASRVVARSMHATFPNVAREQKLCAWGERQADALMVSRDKIRRQSVAVGLVSARPGTTVSQAAALPSASPASSEPSATPRTPSRPLGLAAQGTQAASPVPAGDPLAEAHRLMAEGDVPGASRLFEKDIARAPSGDAYLGLAGCQLRSGDYQAARASAKRGLEVNYEQANLYYTLAEAERGLGDVRAMNHALRQYLVREPRGAHGIEARRLLGLSEP